MDNTTTVDLGVYINKTALFETHEHLKFPIVIVDAKRAYGRLLFKITPHTSARADKNWQDLHGVYWVNASRVTLRSE